MTRPEAFVFIALSVGWVAIAAWAFRIARKVNRLGHGVPTYPAIRAAAVRTDELGVEYVEVQELPPA